MKAFEQSQFQKRRLKIRSLWGALLIAFCVFCILPISRPPSLSVRDGGVYLTEVFSQSPQGESADAGAKPVSKNLEDMPALEKVNFSGAQMGTAVDGALSSAAGFSIDRTQLLGSNFKMQSLPAAAIDPAGGISGIDGLDAGASLDVGAGLGVFELSSLDSIPRRLGKAAVRYPESLLRRGVEGVVRLSVIIDETGALEVLGVESSSDDLFTESALEAAKKLRYEIPMKNGAPVRAKFILPIPFKISK